jgi:hypothetical protein
LNFHLHHTVSVELLQLKIVKDFTGYYKSLTLINAFHIGEDQSGSQEKLLSLVDEVPAGLSTEL